MGFTVAHDGEVIRIADKTSAASIRKVRLCCFCVSMIGFETCFVDGEEGEEEKAVVNGAFFWSA